MCSLPPLLSTDRVRHNTTMDSVQYIRISVVAVALCLTVSLDRAVPGPNDGRTTASGTAQNKFDKANNKVNPVSDYQHVTSHSTSACRWYVP